MRKGKRKGGGEKEDTFLREEGGVEEEGGGRQISSYLENKAQQALPRPSENKLVESRTKKNILAL